MYPCLETVNSLQIVTMHNMLLTETAGLFWPPVSKLTEEIATQFTVFGRLELELEWCERKTLLSG